MFWEFYSSSIKIKSFKYFVYIPSIFINQDIEYNNLDEIGHVFNNFFTNLSSNSFTSEKDCDQFIDRTFAKRKRNLFKKWSF